MTRGLDDLFPTYGSPRILDQACHCHEFVNTGIGHRAERDIAALPEYGVLLDLEAKGGAVGVDVTCNRS